MRSDHWNFLANLLGTPGPAEPPKKASEPSKKAAETPVADKAAAEKPVAKAAAEKSFVEKSFVEKVADKFAEALSPDHDSAEQDETETSKTSELDDVFAGFQRNHDEAKVDRSSPGFGQQKAGSGSSKDASPKSKPSAFSDDSDDSDEHDVEETADGDVLEALTAVTPPPVLPGFGAPARSQGSSSYEPPPRPKADPKALDDAMARRSERPAREERPRHGERPVSGFGGGLVDDADGEDNSWGTPKAPRSRENTRDAVADSAPARSESTRSESSRSESNRSESNRSESSRGESSRSESFRGEPVVRPARGDADDESGGRPARRRRGRRGSRQRISDEDVDKLESGSPAARTSAFVDDEDDDDAPSVATPAARTDVAKKDDDSDDDAPRGRSRRRGRGRGRGRGGEDREPSAGTETRSKVAEKSPLDFETTMTTTMTTTE